MKNKFKIKILIIIFFIKVFFPAFAEDFNFNVTEVQVYQNGNLIKGIKGGKVTSGDNNIEITADNFEYNKLTTLLEAEGNVKLLDKSANVIIESNEVFYLKNKEEIYTKGKSKATSGVNFQIDAENYFKYNKLTTLLEASGKVIINDKQKNTIIKSNEIFYLKSKEKFSTKGETEVFVEKRYKVETSDLIFFRNQGILSSIKRTLVNDTILNNLYRLNEFEYSLNEEILKGKEIKVTTNNKEANSDNFFFGSGFFDFKNLKFLSKDVSIKFHKSLFDDDENDPRINSVAAHGDEYNTYFDKGVFTSCKKTEKCPPWQIASKTIKHDKVKKQIIYKDSWLKIYGVPVVYFPKFFHPDPSVKRQSGFLKPELGSSSTLGDSVYTPYFHVISDDKDITIKPTLFNSKKFVLQNEFRQMTKSSYTIADFSIAKGHHSSSIDREDTRGHLFANSKINLGWKNYLDSKLEINFEKSSNDTYLKLFNFESPIFLENTFDSLESRIKLDLEHEDYDFTGSIEMYETLSGKNNDRYQYALPTYNFSKNFFPENINGSFNFISNGNNKLNTTNVFTSVLSNDLNFKSFDSFLENGIKSNFGISIKNLNSIGKNSSLYKSSPQSEVMSSYTFNTSLPLFKNSEKFFNRLEPKISFRFSPHAMKNHNSSNRRIDMSNIYNENRLSLGDSYEGGGSLTLGVDYKKEKIVTNQDIKVIDDYLDFKLATIFRSSREDNIPSNSTLNKKRSNVFGEINYRPSEIFSVDYNFSINDDLNALEYNSIDTEFKFKNFTTQFNFLEERGSIGNTNVTENILEYNFNDENSLSYKTRRNRNLNLTEYYDLVYQYNNDCLIASVQYKKNYYTDAAIRPVEELFFSITIIPLTTFSPDKIILNKEK
ncbi:organic solvent tolerance protein [Candidatus Pelagibacter sp.]|jgi:LPS-assembly protein|nr:organic solvent tolerance protein [Candidatus Pelagibacter sp.]